MVCASLLEKAGQENLTALDAPRDSRARPDKREGPERKDAPIP